MLPDFLSVVGIFDRAGRSAGREAVREVSHNATADDSLALKLKSTEVHEVLCEASSGGSRATGELRNGWRRFGCSGQTSCDARSIATGSAGIVRRICAVDYFCLGHFACNRRVSTVAGYEVLVIPYPLG